MPIGGDSRGASVRLAAVIDWLGEDLALTAAGAIVGLAFGALAQHSRFCLRSATIELARGQFGAKTAIWALAFSSAVLLTQLAIAVGVLDVSEARQLAAAGSLSGSIIGGSLFGVGMILARGCASRLLVLSATGNLRALLAGLVLTVVAQASLRGVLSPVRDVLSALWVIDGGPGRNLLSRINAGPWTGVCLGGVWLAIGAQLAARNAVTRSRAVAAAGVGAVVTAGWCATYALSLVSFQPVRITSVTFTGPSADTLMALINSRTLAYGFDIGLVPGVFLGSLLAAHVSREFEIVGFDAESPGVARYIAGASLMGFGGMLAGGCAVGAGVTGGAIFALTGWLALAAMWLAAMATDRLLSFVARRCVQAAPATGLAHSGPAHRKERG